MNPANLVLMRGAAAAGVIDTSAFLAINVYAGNGAASRLIAGVDLSAGGISWSRSRYASANHALSFSADGSTVYSGFVGASTPATGVTSFGSTGATLISTINQNNGASYYANWQFRKMSGFLDVVAYTGNGSNRTIAHSLGVEPAVIIIIALGTSSDRIVYHKDYGAGGHCVMDTTGAFAASGGRWNSTAATSTVFSLGTAADVNASGVSFIALVFAHNSAAGIAAFSYTGNGSASGPTVTLGWPPRVIWYLGDSGAASVHAKVLVDTIRTPGFTGAELFTQNTTGPEGSGFDLVGLTGTGFEVKSSSNYVNYSGQVYYGLAVA